MRIDCDAARYGCVCECDFGAGIICDCLDSCDEFRGLCGLAAGDQLPELDGLDLRLDRDGAASLAGEGHPLRVSFSAVSEDGFAGELGRGHVGEV